MMWHYCPRCDDYSMEHIDTKSWMKHLSWIFECPKCGLRHTHPVCGTGGNWDGALTDVEIQRLYHHLEAEIKLYKLEDEYFCYYCLTKYIKNSVIDKYSGEKLGVDEDEEA